MPTLNLIFFFFNDTATTEIYTLSLHDALPILAGRALSRGCRTSDRSGRPTRAESRRVVASERLWRRDENERSEEHTSELQSRQYLVCRLLLEKKKNKQIAHINHVLPLNKDPQL